MEDDLKNFKIEDELKHFQIEDDLTNVKMEVGVRSRSQESPFAGVSL